MENLRCTWNIFSNLSPTLVRIFPLLYNVANKTEKKGVSLIFRNQSETQAFYYISAAQFSDTHAYFRVFLYCIQKSTDQACRTFQSAAAIPDHQQPWRKDR